MQCFLSLFLSPLTHSLSSLIIPPAACFCFTYFMKKFPLLKSRLRLNDKGNAFRRENAAFISCIRSFFFIHLLTLMRTNIKRGKIYCGFFSFSISFSLVFCCVSVAGKGGRPVLMMELSSGRKVLLIFYFC